LFHRAIASGSISSSRFVVSLAIQINWGGPAPITYQINEIRVSSCAAALASPKFNRARGNSAAA
jgi:hypothetical protein